MSHKITDKWQKFLRENKQEVEGKILDKEDGEYQKSIENPVRMKQESDCGGGRDYDEGPEAAMHRTALATIRREAEEVKRTLLNDTGPLDVRVATASAKLDELANDPNIPLHGRTLIWNIMSRLEELA